MYIKFVVGSSGSGKTQAVIQNIIDESINNPEVNYFLIVPEQNTMEMQRALVSKHPNGGIMNIDAIGFNRLAYRIFDELSVCVDEVLEDFGKSMIIKKIVHDHMGELNVYDGFMDKLGFVDEMKSMLSEFYQYRVSEDDMEHFIESLELSGEVVTANKLKDIKLVYEGLNQFLSGGYIVAEQLVEMLAIHAEKSDILKNSYLYFDGFTGFTPVQLNLIRTLMRCVKGMTFSFTIDSNDMELTNNKEHELFYMPKVAIKTLLDMAMEENVEILDNIIMKDDLPYRFQANEEIAWLEKQIFRFPYKKYNKESGLHNIKMVSCNGAKEEAYYVAEKISELIRNGYRYRDIAVVSGDLSESGKFYDQVMREYNIPVFIDANVLMKSNPCSETVRSILDIFATDFSYDSVFRFLKNGMTDLTSDEIEILENYALKRGLRGYSCWNKKVPERFDENNLVSIEAIREKFMDCLVDIIPVFRDKKSTVKDVITALYYFLVKLDVPGKMMQKVALYNAELRYDDAESYQQVFEKMLNLFDKIVALLSDNVMDIKELADLIDVGLSDMEIGIVPPTLDRVLVGDVSRSRLNNIKILFLTGVNEGIIPKAAKKGRLLTESDRKVIEELGVTLAPSDKINAFTEQYYLYMNITKATDKLFISYRRTDKDNKESRPSYILSRIKNIFPKLDEEYFDFNNEKLLTEKSVLRKIVSEGQKNNNFNVNSDIKGLLVEKGYGRHLNAIAEGCKYNNIAVNLSEDTVMLLYGRELLESVSKLETYADCRFKYFVKYGLGLKEREIYGVDQRDLGEIIHTVMEKVCKKVRDTKNNDWNSIDDDTRNSITTDAVNEAVKGYAEDFFDDSKRNAFMLKLINNMALASVATMQKHISFGEMKPTMLERVFDSRNDVSSSYNFDYENGFKMALKGKIDRVDTCLKNDEVCINVVDYKASKKDLKMEDILAGLQLQMCVYSGIAYELEKINYPDKNVRVAGMMYFDYENKITEVDSAELSPSGEEFVVSDALEKAKMSDVKLSGFKNSDLEVLRTVDTELNRVMPIKIKKDGSPYSGTKGLMSDAELLEVFEKTREKIKEMGADICEGDISINPIKQKQRTACDYCIGKSICKFNLTCGGNAFSVVGEIDEEGQEE